MKKSRSKICFFISLWVMAMIPRVSTAMFYSENVSCDSYDFFATTWLVIVGFMALFFLLEYRVGGDGDSTRKEQDEK